MQLPLRVDIGLFAHNEAADIAGTIVELGRQDIFECRSLDVRLLILANGCRDETVAIAERTIAGLPAPARERFDVFDLSERGKSRTAHRFIHCLARDDADLLGFMDADIHIPHRDTVRRMVEVLTSRSELVAVTSRPVKDVVHHGIETGLVGRLIAAGGDGFSDWRTAICGQLFMLRADRARRIGVPAGLPVEDGFMRAMILTDLLTAPEDLTRIDGDPGIFHVYQSIRGVRELIHHQTRIFVGSAINTVLFGRLRRESRTEPQAHALLMGAAAEPDWLRRVLLEELPRLPYGYVPPSLLFKRIRRYRAERTPGRRSTAMPPLGLALDLVAWLRASWVLQRRVGAGYW